MGHLTLAGADLLNDAACEVLRDKDCQCLDRLALHVVDVFQDDLGLPKLELVALTTHGLDKDAEVQDATAINHQSVRRVGVFHLQGEVLLGFLVKTFAQVA